MEAAICCMNAACGALAPPGGGWRKGWSLRSGGFANLCDKCGMAYEQLVFCDLFHQKESGWRECFFCGKRLHCGCIVSKSSLDLLDGGGVQCIACMKHSEPILVPTEAIDFLPQRSHMVLALSSRSPKDEKTNEFSTSLAGSSTCGLGSISADHRTDGEAFAKSKFFQFGESIMGNGHNSFFLAKGESSLNGQFGHIKREQIALLSQASFLNRDQGPITSSQFSQRDFTKYSLKDGMPSESLVMGGATSHMGLPLPTTIEEGIDQNRTLTIQQLQRARHLLPKPPKTCQFAASEASKEVGPLMRVARPPGEGRGRNQLLPRYWPRITDQELQQISGDSNSTIVPLFEKVLSASDAGRIGRLVLPKACAEAYFPPISQPEGLPLKIQDARGKEWQFQFRFWPNNNSRMYVLEGVTPCIQSLQLQAGDTVTFSRIDPEGKLVMGFRKATNSVPMQDSQVSALANGVLGSETFYSDVNENLEIVSGYSGFLESLKGNADQNMSYLSEHLNLPVMEKKKSRNIGSKSKRLLMDHEDAFELKLKWDEAQDLLRPPPAVKPSIVVIEDYEIEEYEEPPVFGKRTIFTARISGGIDQWIQCDDCSKWRRSPVDVLLPSKWTCTENIWDLQRSSCSAPDELSSKELQNIVHQHSELKRRKTAASCSQNPQPESPGLDGLVIGDPDNQNQSLPSIATTTRHPRHRPGCTCIVCIQPPSGKGPKHSPACTCNVCLTVKRRFKTLMMRKKKRQSEREEAEASEKKLVWGGNYEKTETEGLESCKDPIDLNCHPGYNVGPSSSGVSLVKLVERASLPLDTYLKQNGLTSLTSEQQASSSEMTAPAAVGESEGRTPDDGNGDDGGCGDKDKA